MKARALLLSLVFSVIAMGIAFAAPMGLTSDTEPIVEETASPTPTPEPTETEAVVEEEEEEEPEADVEGDHPENHGAAVSTAAHCDLDGKAHGEFVRGVAQDKEATAEDVEAACEEAIAAAEAAAATEGTSEHGKPDKEHGNPHDDETEAAGEESSDVEGGEDGEESSGPGNGKANGHNK